MTLRFTEVELINGDTCIIKINLSILAICALGPTGAQRPSKRNQTTVLEAAVPPLSNSYDK